MSVEFNDIDNDDEEEADDLETGISWLSCRTLTCSNGTVRVQSAILNYIIGPLHFLVGYLCHLDTPRIVLMHVKFRNVFMQLVNVRLSHGQSSSQPYI